MFSWCHGSMWGVRKDGGKRARDCDHKLTRRWSLLTSHVWCHFIRRNERAVMCDPKFKCDPETKQAANQIKHVVGTQMSSEPAGYFPWPNQRVHQWGNTADFIIYSLPGQLEGEPKLGKSPELMDSLNWSARKAKLLVQPFPSTLGQSVKDISSVFNSAHLWCSDGYHSDGMSLVGRGLNIAIWS